MASQLVSISSTLLYVAFILYLVAMLPLATSIKSKSNKPAKIGVTMVIIGFIMQISYFILRWIAQGHAPVSNMYEFITMFAIMIVAGYLITYFYFKTNIFGLFALPISMLLMAYGSMFSREVEPLIPALQSSWLAIHVITVTLAYGILSMSAVAGLIYLLKAVPATEKSWRARFLEAIMAGIVTVIVFIGTTMIMENVVGYQDDFLYTDKQGQNQVAEYHLPSLINFEGAVAVEHTGDNNYEEAQHFHTGINLPPLIDSQKLNTVIWSVILGAIVYGIIRLILRRRIIAVLKPWSNKADLNLMDEIGYRSVIIGFPIFALGGIFFAAIWAQIAWSRFWGWDPKETWAFITFMFYTIFLHLRLNRGYEGEKSAWLAIIGFLLILFNLIAINLLVAGLHSYA
ncbi:c-type cytochrome biogenesis protein CcsB [Salinicoccus sp. ID82-1]|uniref:C-type cytochrome biogenesis protein CcsB n=1 Tax=Salinicoccus cyprini TaxID=2493691 RepID=A0A558AZ28_9STAP|nr:MULTISPECIES: c-type cytochrome biogenesis protein CcsB [Salinicoccus]MCG1009073.1 c-type cytochrome biogenesis protein CcsB [Salinicoccus sp. ID82-1]TVT29520.1 c-type cytochrome biogenesis protein CcsB [Salinicoccus cyprini]